MYWLIIAGDTFDSRIILLSRCFKMGYSAPFQIENLGRHVHLHPRWISGRQISSSNCFVADNSGFLEERGSMSLGLRINARRGSARSEHACGIHACLASAGSSRSTSDLVHMKYIRGHRHEGDKWSSAMRV